MGRFAQRFYEQARVLQASGVVLERISQIVKGHAKPVSASPTAQGHVVDVHERVVRDDEVEARLGERKRLREADDVLAVGILFPGGLHERGRGVEADHPMPSRAEVARDAALAAADFERATAGGRKKLEEGIPVGPVSVVPGRARPRDPIRRLALQTLAHGFPQEYCPAVRLEWEIARRGYLETLKERYGGSARGVAAEREPPAGAFHAYHACAVELGLRPVLLEIDDERPLARLTAALAAQAPVRDVELHEPDIADVVRRIYGE
jgi:hypothetical protein